MDIVTLKISIVNNYLLLKINDKDQLKIKSSGYNILHLDEIFDTSELSILWKKMCKTPCYIYFRYNVTNLNIRLMISNIFNSNINNKALLANLYLNKDDTTLRIDALGTKLDTEINIIIKIIIPSLRCSYQTTNNIWNTNITRNNYIHMFNFCSITTQIKLQNPNPMFRLCKIDTLADYDKKIKSFRMPLYTERHRAIYDVIFDLYPTQSTCYILITSEIINNLTSNSYRFHFDKDCTKCVNRIKGCELNMISKVQLCCICNINLVKKDFDKFIDKNVYQMCIHIKDFPSYIKDNFNTYPNISI